MKKSGEKEKNFSLYYTESGTGFPLVLLHGNGESSDYFAAQIPYFSASFRVIAVDTRGHGRSPRGDAPFTLEQFARDLRALLDSLAITRVHLLGFSDGANIALLFALAYPSYVERLVLNGADLCPSGVKLTVQVPIVRDWLCASFRAIYDRSARATREMLGLMVNQPHIKRKDLSALTMPTLVIVGTNDMIRDSHSRRIAASIPGAQFVCIEGDHFIAAGNSVKFNAATERFLLRRDN